MIDGLLAAAVLGMAAVAVVGPVMAARQQTEAVAGQGEALALARQMMEEIAAKPYADPDDGNIILGPDPMESTRALFDNIDDYHGYSDVTTSLRTMRGEEVVMQSAVTAETETEPKASADPAPRRQQTYERRVNVVYQAGPSGPEVAAGDFAVVRVWVRPVDAKGQGVGDGVELSVLVTRVSLKR